jgi:hypothetical protein
MAAMDGTTSGRRRAVLVVSGFERLEARTAASAIHLLHNSASSALAAHSTCLALPPWRRRCIEPLRHVASRETSLASGCAFCDCTASPTSHYTCVATSASRGVASRVIISLPQRVLAFAANEALSTRGLYELVRAASGF